MRVKLSELETLHSCLERAVVTQKKLAETLQFFARQFEDERKIMAEAQSAVGMLIAQGKATGGR